jgi:FkbM family methyltransferase
MIKDFLKSWLQKLLGYDNYLFLFALFCINRMQWSNYEKSFKYFLELIPNDDGAILDIGANIGMMSVPLAKKFTKRKIYAFEPMPSNIAALKKVLNKYKCSNVVLQEVAVGEKEGTIKMVLPVIKNSKRQGLSHVWKEGNDEEWNTGEMYTVPIVKLDLLTDLQAEQRISAIKMDVENFEFEVLKGSLALIRKHRPIIYTELWENDNRLNCISFFKQMDYDVKVFEQNEMRDYVNQSEINFFFLPKPVQL